MPLDLDNSHTTCSCCSFKEHTHHHNMHTAAGACTTSITARTKRPESLESQVQAVGRANNHEQSVQHSP